MTEFCKMPEEMGLEILSRLPPKSLIRFKCVHKSWCILINNPSFVSKHLSTGMHNNHSTCLLLKRLVAKDTDANGKETVFSLITIGNDNDDGEDNIHYVMEDMTKGQLNGHKVLQSAWIVGNCNGIICLADLSYVIMLLNPAIMEFKLVTFKPYAGEILNLGFGYDPKSKNYKVVHISRLREEIYGDRHLLFNPCAVEVYTAATDSWRQIMTDSLETETTNLYPHDFQIYFKGFCYWTGCEQLKEFISVYDHAEEEELRQVLILFDMGEEVFHYILFPDSLYESCVCWYGMCVIVWKESIALFGMDHGIIDAESWGLWVMDDVFGGVKGYWIKQYTFGHAEGIDAPLQFWKRDEILLVSDEGCIVSYNLDTEDLTHLRIHTMVSECYEFVAYMTSIVAIIDSNMGHSRDSSLSVSCPKN